MSLIRKAKKGVADFERAVPLRLYCVRNGGGFRESKLEAD